jgi:hypothetical protein
LTSSSVGDGQHATLQRAGRPEPQFGSGAVLKFERTDVKQPNCRTKINPVLLEIALPFGFVPLEFHGASEQIRFMILFIVFPDFKQKLNR